MTAADKIEAVTTPIRGLRFVMRVLDFICAMVVTILLAKALSIYFATRSLLVGGDGQGNGGANIWPSDIDLRPTKV